MADCILVYYSRFLSLDIILNKYTRKGKVKLLNTTMKQI